MSITVYEKPTCTTCKKLNALLTERGIDFNKINYHIDQLSEEKIRELIELTGMPASELLRLREPEAKELKGKDDEAIIKAMTANPALLQRPIVVNGNRAVLARPIERVLEII